MAIYKYDSIRLNVWCVKCLSDAQIKDGSATRELQLRRLQPGLQPVAEP